MIRTIDFIIISWYNNIEKDKTLYLLKGVFYMTVLGGSGDFRDFSSSGNVSLNAKNKYVLKKNPVSVRKISLASNKANVSRKKYDPKGSVCFIRPVNTKKFIETINKTVPTEEEMNMIRKSASLFNVNF